MLPADGRRNLVRRLKHVVLPAPFGPISAWMVPRRILSETSRTAKNPANSFVNPWVSRMNSSAKQIPPEPARSARPSLLRLTRLCDDWTMPADARDRFAPEYAVNRGG